MTKENIVEKIKKLFSLSNSSNPNESSLALAKAQQMMIQHGIDESQLVNKNITDIIEVDFEITKRFNTHVTHFAYHLGKTFNVRPILCKTRTGYHNVDSKITFIGDKEDIAVSTYVFGYILDLVNKKSDEYYESVRYKKAKWTPIEAKKLKSDYAFGFICSIVEKLKEIQKQNAEKFKYQEQVSNALMVVKDKLIDEYIKNNVGKTKEGKAKNNTNNPEHFGKGQVEGSKYGVFKGVSSNNNNLQIGG